MPLGTRLFGIGGTALIGVLIIGVALFKWTTTPPPVIAVTLSVFDVPEPETPPAPETEAPPAPEQVENRRTPQIEVLEIPPPLVEVPHANPMRAPVAEPRVDAAAPTEQAHAPEARPLPTASPASAEKPAWEGQVLAALNRAKRYPREASFRRQQGVPWIRFVLDREGRVRAVQLERSSGIETLDREALALPARAQPFPKPPGTVIGDQIELVVPVEFFLNAQGR